MDRDNVKQARDRNGRRALKTQAEVAEHIRTCARCERLFLVAYEASADQWEQDHPAPSRHLWVHPSEVWLITRELLREFRECSNWPKEV